MYDVPWRLDYENNLAQCIVFSAFRTNKETLIIAPAIKCCQEDTPDKGLDCAEEEGGDAEASATDDDKAAGPLDKQILAIFGCRSNNL